MFSPYSKMIGCFTVGTLCTFSSFSLNAQQVPPTSGSLNKQNESLPEIKTKEKESVFEQFNDEAEEPASQGPLVKVRKIRIEGARQISQHDILENLKDEIGKQHDFASLKQIALRVTRQYRDKGYFTAWAYLPAQSIANGELVIIVLEGKIEEIIVENEGRLKPKVTRRFIDRIQQDASLKTDELEKQLRLLNDLPGVKAKARLIPGEKLGGSVLKLATSDKPIFNGNISLDNLGNRFTNATRLGTLLQSNNAFGYGEYLQMRLASSEEGYQFAQLRAGLPVGTYGGRINIGVQRSDYELQKQFKALGAEGDNTQLDLNYQHPWVRSLSYNLNSAISFKRAIYQDSNNNLGQFSDREIDSIEFSISGDYIDEESNFSQFSASLALGDVSDDMLADSSDLYNIKDNFSRLLLTGQHSRWLNDSWRLQVKGIAQFSEDNLNSSEKLLLGGPQGIRAYPQGESLVDQGALISTEVFYHYSPQWLFSAFFEAAMGERYIDPLPGDINNDRELSGAGLALQWRPNEDWFLSLSSAWRTDSAPLSDEDKTPRLWAQIIWQF